MGLPWSGVVPVEVLRVGMFDGLGVGCGEYGGVFELENKNKNSMISGSSRIMTGLSWSGVVPVNIWFELACVDRGLDVGFGEYDGVLELENKNKNSMISGSSRTMMGLHWSGVAPVEVLLVGMLDIELGFGFREYGGVLELENKINKNSMSTEQ